MSRPDFSTPSATVPTAQNLVGRYPYRRPTSTPTLFGTRAPRQLPSAVTLLLLGNTPVCNYNTTVFPGVAWDDEPVNHSGAAHNVVLALNRSA